MNLTWIVQHLWLPCWMMLNGAECYFIAIRLLIQLNSTLPLSSCRYEQQRWIFLASNCKQCWTNAHAGNINLGNSITFNIVQRGVSKRRPNMINYFNSTMSHNDFSRRKICLASLHHSTSYNKVLFNSVGWCWICLPNPLNIA